MMRGGSKINNVKACLLVGGYLQQGESKFRGIRLLSSAGVDLVFSLVFNDRRSRFS